MPWPLLMLFQNMFSASFALFSRSIAKNIKQAHFQINAVIFTVILLSGSSWALSQGGIDIRYLTNNLPIFIFAGICFAITNIASYRVFEYTDAAIASIMSTLNTLAAVIIGTIALGEGLSTRQIIGAILLFSAIWLVLSTKVKPEKRGRWLTGLGFSLIAALFFGIATSTEKHLLNSMSTANYILFGWGFQWLASMTLRLMFRPGQWKKLYRSTQLKKVIGAGFIRAGGGFLFIFSLVSANNVSVISVLAGVKAIFVVVLGASLLKEKEYMTTKMQGALLAMTGIAVMLWR